MPTKIEDLYSTSNGARKKRTAVRPRQEIRGKYPTEKLYNLEPKSRGSKMGVA
jgi:hypothetical protein